jgi:hypothetical protein
MKAPRVPAIRAFLVVLVTTLGVSLLAVERDDRTVVSPAVAFAQSVDPLAPRRGGKVKRAWPARPKGRKPRTMLQRWLAKQVGSGGAPASGRLVTSPLVRGERGELLVYAEAEAPAPLALVRSYDIPIDDPSYERLLNFSWTYDSALAAMAFTLLDDRRQADQLLSQLAALQREDGSLEYGWDTHTGAGVPLFRSGSLAAVGLATVQFRMSTRQRQYDPMANLAARWLLTQQENDNAHPGNGLLYGGPDATWMSTQHNILAYFFLRRFHKAAYDDAEGLEPIFECVYKDGEGRTFAVFGYDNQNPYQGVVQPARNFLTPPHADGPQPLTFEPGRHYAVFSTLMDNGQGNPTAAVWHLGKRNATAKKKGPACEPELVIGAPAPGPALSDFEAAADRIAEGIERVLLVDDETGLHFLQGYDDHVLPLDTQALGILFLLDRGRGADAARVRDYLVARYSVGDRAIALSSDPNTYNMTHAAPGPFLGFRPYGNDPSPDVLWMEGTGEARFALALLGDATSALDAAIEAWRAVTQPRHEGLLGADRTAFDPDFNEYHVWPTSAATSWYLLSRAVPSASVFVAVP